MKVHACICLVSLFFRFVEHCSTRNHCIYFQVILCFCLFLIENIYTGRQQQDKKVTCQNFKIDGLSSNEPSRFCLLPFSFHHIIETNLLV